jgi:hypothetical protein
VSCVGLSLPAFVRGSRRSDGAIIPTTNQVATTVRTVAISIPAAMIATSRFVKSAKALDEARRQLAREGWCYRHVQAIMVAIDQYAEAATGNREYFLNKPHSIDGSRRGGNVP